MGKKCMYEVDYITRMKVEDGKRFFRVKWIGYPTSQNTWEPEEHLNQALIETFIKQQKQKEQKKQISRQKNRQGEGSGDKFTLRILEMNPRQDDKNEYEFVILTGFRKSVVSRDYLFDKYPSNLAKFYLDLYLKQKKLQVKD